MNEHMVCLTWRQYGEDGTIMAALASGQLGWIENCMNAMGTQ